MKNYTILEKIGEGGYGLVYLAEQQSTGRKVALKTIKLTEGIDKKRYKQQLARFERETKLCAEINHPNIVQLVDKGYTERKEPFAVFEYLKGQNLKNFIFEKKGLTVMEMADVMEQVLDALSCAHQKGIVHRDLKPENIMVSNINNKLHVKILDFGISAFTSDFRSTDYQSLTITRDVLGTPTYSAPEQLRGEQPTIKSDLYAWGLIVLECLTGQQVMNGETVAEVFQQQLMSSNVPIPSSILGHPLALLLRRVLEKNPKNRIDDTHTLLQEFESINFGTLTGSFTQESAASYSEEGTLVNDLVWSSSEGIKKQITVLCLKLSLVIPDKTSLDLEIIDVIQKDQINLCKDTASRYGGYLSGVLLNNLVVFFGYPDSEDTDARRAGRTALEIITEVKDRSQLLMAQHGVGVDVKIGLHTGVVLVNRNHVPEGNVPNTAFELTQRAESGTVLVSETSKKLLDSFLDFKESEVLHFSNEPHEIKCFQLRGERQTEAFSSLKPWSANKPMIGREGEKEVLLDKWNNCVKGEGVSILVNGQAGIGKSKLIYEIKKEVRVNGHIIKECRCLPEHRNNALYPVLTMFRNHWGVLNSDDDQFIRSKLVEFLEEADCSVEEVLPLLCSWLSVSLPQEIIIKEKTPDEQKKILFSALQKMIFHLGQKKALLLVVEDLHWIDPTTQDFIQFLLSRIRGKAILLLMTTRPEFVALSDTSNFSQIDIDVLSKKSVNELVEEGFGQSNVSEDVLEYVFNRTDGIPFFIEELTSMLRERGYVVQKDDVYELVSDIENKEIPITLHGLLNARLDALGIAKETAQLAATLGREFDLNLLIKTSIKDEGLVQVDLDELIRADLLYRQRRVNGERYIFRHALIRDAAYESMVTTHRRETHATIAKTIQAVFPEIVEQSPFLVAQHFAASDSYGRAVDLGVIAAKKAIDRSLGAEVLDYTKTLISWFNEQEKEMVNDDALLKVYCIRANALMNKYGWASEEVKKVSNRAFDLIHDKGIKSFKLDNIISAYWVLFTYFHVASDRDKADVLTSEFLEIASTGEDQNIHVSAQTIRGIHLFISGKLDKANTVLSNVVDLVNEQENSKPNYTIGLENFCWAAACLAYPLWLSGDRNKAKEVTEFALDRAREIDHKPTLAIVLFYAGNLCSWNNDKEGAGEYSLEAILISKKHNLLGPLIYGSVINHWANDDLEALDQTLARLEASGGLVGITKYKALAADLEFQKGNYEKAFERIEDCLKLCDNIKEYYYHSELLRIREEYALKVENELE